MMATILETQDSTQFDSGEGHPNWYVCRPLNYDEDEKNSNLVVAFEANYLLPSFTNDCIFFFS